MNQIKKNSNQTIMISFILFRLGTCLQLFVLYFSLFPSVLILYYIPEGSEIYETRRGLDGLSDKVYYFLQRVWQAVDTSDFFSNCLFIYSICSRWSMDFYFLCLLERLDGLCLVKEYVDFWLNILWWINWFSLLISSSLCFLKRNMESSRFSLTIFWSQFYARLFKHYPSYNSLIELPGFYQLKFYWYPIYLSES